MQDMFGPGFDSRQLHFFTIQMKSKARKLSVYGLFCFLRLLEMFI